MTVLTNKKREGIDIFVLFPSVAETPEAFIKDQESPLPIIPFGLVVYGFVGHPFSKQLYTTVLFIFPFLTFNTLIQVSIFLLIILPFQIMIKIY